VIPASMDERISLTAAIKMLVIAAPNGEKITDGKRLAALGRRHRDQCHAPLKPDADHQNELASTPHARAAPVMI
jgi:hypothetical protein